MLYRCMVVSGLTGTSLKQEDVLESIWFLENLYKIIMIRVNTKEGSLLKKANFQEQWPY
jgi:hypothetical protein